MLIFSMPGPEVLQPVLAHRHGRYLCRAADRGGCRRLVPARSRRRGRHTVRDRLHCAGTISSLRRGLRRSGSRCRLVFRGRRRPMKYRVIMAGVALRGKTGSQHQQDHGESAYFCTHILHRETHATTILNSRTYSVVLGSAVNSFRNTTFEGCAPLSDAKNGPAG